MVFLFSGQWKKICFFKLFFLYIYYCSFERKFCGYFWKAINCCFSPMNCGIVTLSRLFRYFLLYKLDLWFKFNISFILNKIRKLCLIFLVASSSFLVIAFAKIWSQISSRNHDVNRTYRNSLTLWRLNSGH